MSGVHGGAEQFFTELQQLIAMQGDNLAGCQSYIQGYFDMVKDNTTYGFNNDSTIMNMAQELINDIQMHMDNADAHAPQAYNPFSFNFSNFMSGFLNSNGTSSDTSVSFFATGQTMANKYAGAVLAPNGKIIMIPHSSNNVGIFTEVGGRSFTLGPTFTKSGSSANQEFRGGVLTPDGKIVFIPYFNDYIHTYDPIANTLTRGFRVVVNTSSTNYTAGFAGGVLAPNGKVIMVPYNGTSKQIGIYDYTTGGFTFGPTPATPHFGAVLAPNGNVILLPTATGAGSICVYDPVANAIVVESGAVGLPFVGGTILPNGSALFVPYTSSGASNVCFYNPALSFDAGAYTAGPATNINLFKGGDFMGGALRPDGKVFFAPAANQNMIGIYNSNNNTFAHGASCNLTGYAYEGYDGAVLSPNGAIILVPGSSNYVAIVNSTYSAPIEYCLSPYINKF